MPIKSDMKDDKAVEMSNDWYREALEVNEEWLHRAKESFRFYCGIGQWEESDLAVLQRQGRPALTINHCFPLVNMLSGYQRKNRSDITLYPRRAATEAIAALGTGLIKHTMDVSGGTYEYSDSFFDACICGKGWIGVDKSYQQDPVNGDLEVAKRSPFNILEDQNNRSPILDKGDFVFETYWWGRERLEIEYPKHAKDLDNALESPDWQGDYYDPMSMDDYGEDPTAITMQEHIRQREEQFLVKELWYKKWELARYLVHKPTLTLQPLNDKQFKWAAANNSNPDVALVERPMHLLHKLITVGELVLEHWKDPLDGIQLYPYFRIVPYWVDGYVMGVIDGIKEPQQELNKRRSQALHHLNTTANSLWRVANASNAAAVRELKRDGSKPGYIADESKFGGKIERDPPPQLDQAHMVLSERSGQDIKDISGINTALVETQSEPKESGRAKALRMEAGLTIAEIVFDNSNRTEQSLGTFLWEVIRTSDVYAEEEIVSVIQEHNIEQFMVPDAQGRPTLDLTPLQSVAMGRYGVKAARSPNVPTMKLANYESLLQAMQIGLPIPPEFLIELSDLPNKEKIMAFLAKMSQVPTYEQQRNNRRAG